MLARSSILVTAAALALAALSGCTTAPASRAPAAAAGYAEQPSAQGADPFPNWPVSPDEAERLILHARYVLLGPAAVAVVGLGSVWCMKWLFSQRW
jgi:hypothetical protein